MTYFDWNATTPMLPVAREAWLAATESEWGNPSAGYRHGARAKVLLDECRESMASLLGVDPGNVIFTSGATESCNAMLRESARQANPDKTIWISSVEHPAVREAALHYWGPSRVRQVPVLSSGIVDMDWIKDRLEGAIPALVCLMAANNETGVIQPLEEVHALCEARRVPVFCDAVQWVGKSPGSPVPWSACAGIALSAHKFGGPKGTGCLVVDSEHSGLRLSSGGGQENGARAGTEDVAGIAAMAAALREREEAMPSEHHADHRQAFEEALLDEWPNAVIHGREAPRIGNTCLVSVPEFASTRWIPRLDKLGFQLSTGAACSAGKRGPSMVMQAMGVPDDVARRTLRISAGWETRGKDWMNLLRAMKSVDRDLRDEAADGPGTVIEI